MRHRRVRKIRSLMLALATRRPFASAAATAAASASPLVVTRLQNGVNVAVAEDVGLLSRVSLVMQTGSRQQAAPGAAHILKNLLFRTVPDDTITRTVRGAELRGNSLETSHSREAVMLSATFMRDDLPDIVPLLTKNAMNSTCAAYEFLDAREFSYQETANAMADPLVRISETLHNLAFRSGLGASMYASPDLCGALERKDVFDAMKQWSGQNVSVIASGVDAKDLIPMIEESFSSISLAPSAGISSSTKSTYFGGNEARIVFPGKTSYYAVAFPSVSRALVSDHAAALVLCALLDGTPRVKYGLGAGLTPSSVSAFYNGYSDAGLTGFVVSSSDPKALTQAAQQTLAVLKSLAAGSTDVMSSVAIDGAKARAVVGVAESASSESTVFGKCTDMLVTGNLTTSSVLAEAIVNVGKADISKLAEKALKDGLGPCAVALGDTSALPWFDEL